MSDYVDLNEQADQIEFNVYPNPAQNFVKISLAEKNATVELIDAMGRSIENINTKNERTITINRNGLDAGLYFIKVSGKNGSALKAVTFN